MLRDNVPASVAAPGDAHGPPAAHEIGEDVGQLLVVGLGFTGGPTNGLAPLTLMFTNVSSGATNYAWDFGDGHTSRAFSPTNTYASAGTNTVKLTAIG